MTTSLGLLIGPALFLYKLSSVFFVLGVTLGVSVGLSIIGVLFSSYNVSLKTLGGILLMSLTLLIFGDIARGILLSFGIAALGWIDYVAVVIFSIYIIYDWNRALEIPATIDNAVDASGALILDVVNLFLRLLSIMGSKK